MRLLFVASRFPYPPLQGDRARGYHFLRLLNQRHSVTLVAPVAGTLDAQSKEAVSKLCTRWVPVRVPRWRAIAHLMRFPLCTVPLQTLYFSPPALTRQVQALLLQESPFDLVHVQLARLGPVCSGVGGVPKVLDFIDSLALNMRRRGDQERGPKKWFFSMEAQRMARYERELTFAFHQQTVCSPLDREYIGAGENLHVIPNGVAIDDFPYTDEGREGNLIVLTGRMGYFPNSDAAVYFATEVLPLIRRQVPDARFDIVGAHPPRRVQQLARLPGVLVTGYVPRIQEYLARASVAVAPMRSGSGMQFKVIEAMAGGIPVVATPYAIGGIEAVSGENLFIAETAEGLAEQTVRLLKDPTLRRRLARSARRLVEAKYTWERSVAMLDDVYRLAMLKGKNQTVKNQT